MKTYTPTELVEILTLHSAYLRGEANGVRANLSGANLSGANLRSANLKDAYLSGANLSGANLSGAYLSGAYLSGAYLSGANLSGAYLRSANLKDAYLSGANLKDAYLSGAYLSGANLIDAKLNEATTLPHAQIVPEVGSFIGFKKLNCGAIAELYVPRSAKRIGGLIGRKCRVSKAKVRAIIAANGKPVAQAVDKHTQKLVYKVGAWVRPDSFEENQFIECAPGIHLFITRKEAEEY